MSISEKIKAALESLGDTADEVADTLRVLGCHGESGDTEKCPVARFVMSVAEREGWDWQSVNVFDIRTFIWAERRHGQINDVDAEEFYNLAAPTGSRLACRIDNPSAVAAFINAFDNGCYRDLDEEAAALSPEPAEAA